MKVACLVTGPYRYLNEVISQLEKYSYKEEVSIDVYVHIWEQDLGNKARGLDYTPGVKLESPLIKKVMVEKPLSSDYFESKLSAGFKNETHSSVSAMCGMFLAINRLYNEVSKDVNIDDYDYLIRMRTDIAFTCDNLIPKKEKPNFVYVSSNPLIDKSKVSDHTMMLSPSNFKKVWCFTDLSEFLKDFSAVNLNPEKLIKQRLCHYSLQTIEVWKRYVDYHVVYKKAKRNDPYLIKNLNSPEEIFDYKLDALQRSLLMEFYSKIYHQTHYPNLWMKIRRHFALLRTRFQK